MHPLNKRFAGVLNNFLCHGYTLKSMVDAGIPCAVVPCYVKNLSVWGYSGNVRPMDNISHSLVGLALGELVQRSLPAEPDAPAQALRRRMLLVTCLAASNVPDLDLVLGPTLAPPLGYLLHHRGYTHTLLFALAQALLLAALTWLSWPAARRLLQRSAAARGGLLAVTGIGLVLHIAMDYLNSYGVHPFYPFDARWYYGDTLFIVEPVLWVAFGVPLALMLRSRLLTGACVLMLAGVLAWTSARGYLDWTSLLGLASGGALLAWLQQRAGAGRRALVAAFLLAGAFVGVEHLASSLGKRQLLAELQRRDPASRVLDISMTGFPANPLCWVFVSVERNDGAASYRLRRGLLSVAPGLMPVRACPAALSEPLAKPSAAFGIAWESQASLAGLRKLAANCHVHAWLRFARAPALDADSATDVRFSTSDGNNFTTLPFAAFGGQPCPDRVPPWDLPRQDLLSP